MHEYNPQSTGLDPVYVEEARRGHRSPGCLPKIVKIAIIYALGFGACKAVNQIKNGELCFQIGQDRYKITLDNGVKVYHASGDNNFLLADISGMKLDLNLDPQDILNNFTWGPKTIIEWGIRKTDKK